MIILSDQLRLRQGPRKFIRISNFVVRQLGSQSNETFIIYTHQIMLQKIPSPSSLQILRFLTPESSESIVCVNKLPCSVFKRCHDKRVSGILGQASLDLTRDKIVTPRIKTIPV